MEYFPYIIFSYLINWCSDQHSFASILQQENSRTNSSLPPTSSALEHLSLSQLHLSSSSKPNAKDQDLWDDFERMQFGSQWRFTHINKDYSVRRLSSHPLAQLIVSCVRRILDCWSCLRR
jgi:hypothetical protein